MLDTAPAPRITALDVIEAAVGLDGHAANAIENIARHDLAQARWYVDRLRQARSRVPRRGTLGLDYQVRALDAFGLDGHARAALGYLFDAIESVAEDRYRAHLNACSQALTQAIRGRG